MLQTFDERNRDLMVSIGGRLSHRDEAGVSPFDSVVQGGDAVWEGLRLYRSRIFRLDEHLARLRRSAQAIAFTQVPSDEEIIAEIRRTLAANVMTDNVHIRLTLTTASTRRHSPDTLDPKIHHNNLLTSILAKVEANVAGADDAIMLDQRGFVAETNATHLFLVSGGVLGTPTTGACPEGITRQAVLDLAATAGLPVAVGDYSLTQLYAADEVFVTGTMGGLTPVLTIDGRQIGDGKPGPVTLRLTEEFAKLTATSGTQVCG